MKTTHPLPSSTPPFLPTPMINCAAHAVKRGGTFPSAPFPLPNQAGGALPPFPLLLASPWRSPTSTNHNQEDGEEGEEEEVRPSVPGTTHAHTCAQKEGGYGRERKREGGRKKRPTATTNLLLAKKEALWLYPGAAAGARKVAEKEEEREGGRASFFINLVLLPHSQAQVFSSAGERERGRSEPGEREREKRTFAARTPEEEREVVSLSTIRPSVRLLPSPPRIGRGRENERERGRLSLNGIYPASLLQPPPLLPPPSLPPSFPPNGRHEEREPLLT